MSDTTVTPASSPATDSAATALPAPVAIFSLSGLAGAGKDTVAEHLVDHYGSVQLAFADKLRDSLLALDPIITTDVDGPEGTHAVRLREHIAAHGWERTKDTVPEVRRLMQRLGTEAGREIHGDHLWLDALTTTFRAVCRQHPGAPVVISDARFPNEVAHTAWLGELVGTTPAAVRHIWIDRPGHTRVAGRAATHASENALGPDHPLITDLVLNDDSQAILYQRIDALCTSLGLTSTCYTPVDS